MTADTLREETGMSLCCGKGVKELSRLVGKAVMLLENSDGGNCAMFAGGSRFGGWEGDKVVI
jgi:hypothetical protein